MGKPKAVNVKLIRREGEDTGAEMYAILDALIDDHHEEINTAKVALAWNLSWQPDVDGRVTLGKCRKSSDLDREFSAFDFVILLNADFWQNAAVNDDQRRALLDHELCHAQPALDARTGDQIVDTRGRRVWRIRKHDVEEFSEIVHRHGTWKRDLEKFAQALQRGKQAQSSLFDAQVSLTSDGKTVAFGSGREFKEACDAVAEEARRH
jgi:hypothetical protein